MKDMTKKGRHKPIPKRWGVGAKPGAPKAGPACRFCQCTMDNPCRTDDGPCYWIETPKSQHRGGKKTGVCSNPKCVLALHEEKKRAKKEEKR
jgi:hypothetical protein